MKKISQALISVSDKRNLKKILSIGQNLNGFILILDLLNLNFRKVKLKKLKNVPE